MLLDENSVIKNISTFVTEFLRKVQPQQIVDAAPKTISDADIRNNVGLAFVPSVEAALEPEDDEFKEYDQPFLTESPTQILKEGKFHKVPLMVGFNMHEAMLFIRRE